MACVNGCGCGCEETVVDATVVTQTVLCDATIDVTPCDVTEQYANFQVLEWIRRYLCSLVMITTTDTKLGQLIDLKTTTYPIVIPVDPSSYTTLPATLLDGYRVTVEFDTGYINWVYKDAVWTVVGREFIDSTGLTSKGIFNNDSDADANGLIIGDVYELSTLNTYGSQEGFLKVKRN